MASSKKIGFIPLRKGSKGIPQKNRRKMLGRPLFTWVLKEAVFSELDEVVVFTDDETIINFVESQYRWTNKIKAVRRSAESASDTASTEQAILEYCTGINYNFDVFCLLQATSPLTTSNDINATLLKVTSEGYDAALTVVKTHRFIWNKNGTPANYNVFNRPRRQDFEGLLVENGAVYATSKSALQQSKNRISGKIALVEMPEDSLLEIDSETDWLLAEKLLVKRLKNQKIPEKITHLVLDVDGVFTDGSIYYSKEGEALKRFDMRDGMGLEILREHGVEVWVITSENSELVAQRMKKLNIEHAYLGVKDKFALLANICNSQNLSLKNIAYIGDDVNDLANICSVGWGITPNNATQTVKNEAVTILNAPSGNGAIREACELILKHNQRYEQL